ncbi:MAG: response regulator [Candidatus Cyclobacteriaceae bacterium M2_1C_046]
MSKKILVVDDSYYMRTILKNMIIDAGYEVVDEAANGQDARKLAKKENPDLITLDLILPDNSGLDVLKEIKNAHPDIHVIVVSAVGQETIVQQALEAGAEAYIIKPFEEQKVVHTIKEVLAKKN